MEKKTLTVIAVANLTQFRNSLLVYDTAIYVQDEYVTTKSIVAYNYEQFLREVKFIALDYLKKHKDDFSQVLINDTFLETKNG